MQQRDQEIERGKEIRQGDKKVRRESERWGGIDRPTGRLEDRQIEGRGDRQRT